MEKWFFSIVDSLPAKVGMYGVAFFGFVQLARLFIQYYQTKSQDVGGQLRDDLMRAYTEMREELDEVKAQLRGYESDHRGLRQEIHSFRQDMKAIAEKYPEAAPHIHKAVKQLDEALKDIQ